jgi:hypothetical protein
MNADVLVSTGSSFAPLVVAFSPPWSPILIEERKKNSFQHFYSNEEAILMENGEFQDSIDEMQGVFESLLSSKLPIQLKEMARLDLSNKFIQQNSSLYLVNNQGLISEIQKQNFYMQLFVANNSYFPQASVQHNEFDYIAKANEQFPPYFDGDIVQGDSREVWPLKNCTRRAFPDAEIFSRLGYEFNNVKRIQQLLLVLVPVGPEMS